MSRPLAYLLALASAAACGSATFPDADLVLSPVRAEYTAGEPVEAELLNRSREPMGYGACSLHLERRVGNGWGRVDPPQACISILYVLEPGRRIDVLMPLRPELPTGEYRLQQQVLPGTRLPERLIHSPSFRVRGPAELR